MGLNEMNHVLRRWSMATIGALLGWAACSCATAAEPPTAPQLRIEAGMHTATIWRIATDTQARWAVTASDDKTARVWELASGRLLQVLRVPLGEGNEGKLFAAALSPDGEWVAVAGWTGLDWYGKADIYLFDRQTGQLRQRLRGLPEVINHLAFSPDGRWLGATLGGSSGLRVWRVPPGPPAGAPPWPEPLVDADYGDQSYAASFAPAPPRRDGDPWLATSSLDGKLRLYRLPATLSPGTPLRPTVVQPAPGGKRPYGLAHSPDGQLLAVGDANSTRIDVLDARSLALRHQPDTRGVDDGILSSVAFTADGQMLAAAGQWSVQGRITVRRWPQAGKGAPRDTPITLTTLTGLVALPASAGGGFLVGASDPAWGQLTADGRWQLRGGPPVADLRGAFQEGAFLLADGGRRIQFGFEEWGKPPHQFDLRQRRLLPVPLSGGQPPRTEGLKIEDWINTTNPSLNRRPLKLEKYETSRSLAVLPDASGFALGADFRLRMYGADGVERWPARAVPGVVWGVNIPQTGDLAGKIIVAAYGDGTLRWHRVSDGKELLAFFPHADRKRWVLWTPSGYYDASPGGEDLIGWHLNRGADAAADFFPAGRFRDRFYRPDIIDRVLDTLDEAQAVARADATRGSARPSTKPNVAQALPPVVVVLSSSEVRGNSSQMTVRVQARVSADAPVTAWRVRVNGELVTTQSRNMEVLANAPAGPRELTVPLPPRDSEVQVFAENRHGVSAPALVRVAWQGPVTRAVRKPRLYVLAIGVGKYASSHVNPLGDLPSKDARDFVAAVRLQQGRLYEKVEVKLLTDGEATRDSVADALEWLQRQPQQFDVSMLFVSGHGFMDPAMGYLFLPTNADPEAMKRTTVNWADFKSTVGAMAGKRVVFMDTCHAGNALGTQFKAPYNDITGVIADLAAAENGVVVFASSTGRQLSIQDPAWGNGAFTKAVVEGLKGQANRNERGEVTHKRLSVYVSERVHKLTGGRQTPVNPDPVGVPDFPIALLP